MKRRATHPRSRSALERTVLEFLRGPDYRPMTLREVLRRMGVSEEEKKSLRGVIQELLREGRIERHGARLTLPGAAVPRREARGRAAQDGGGAARSPQRRQRPADRGPVSTRERPLVGVVRFWRDDAYIVSFDPSADAPVRIVAEDTARFREGDAVVAGRVRPPRGGRPPEASVEKVLGPMDRPGTDVLVVSHRHGLALEFPLPVLAEAGRLPDAVDPAGAGRRQRFDDPPPVTIDGETARDFDDAVAVSDLPGGGFRLFVHIADVAHFVRVGSRLDGEARRRGTSVYFPDRVLPMLPEKLSNDLCSLRPGEDRLVQSAILDLDGRGEVVKVRFADGVIRSEARLTYTQVADLLEKGESRAGVTRPVADMLRSADRLREILEEKRRKRGSVDLDLPEPQILLDVEGAMTGIRIEPRNRAHRMIEEFMLAANEAVARHLESHAAPCLYRVHESPDPAKIETLAAFASSLGLRLAVPASGIRPGDLQKLLDGAEGRPEYPIVAQVVLRSMRQARYTGENLGHFGLAAPVYCHFTSPIRRYPDLVVHRLLRGLRHGRREAIGRLARGLDETGESCSVLEREAEAAERELLEWKKLAFVRHRVGEQFEGIVTGVAAFGVFVRLTENLVEGLIHVARLGGDRFAFEGGRQELRGERTGRRLRLGDRLRVVLERVDPVLRRVDLALAGPATPARAPSRPVAGRVPPRRRSPGRGRHGGRR